MKLEVRYFSKSGNTKKLAEVIAEEAGCKAQDISVPLDGYADILFLGAAVYGGGISLKMKEYIQALDKDKIGKVAVFSTSALSERAFPQIRQELEGKGIAFLRRIFIAGGSSLHFIVADRTMMIRRRQGNMLQIFCRPQIWDGNKILEYSESSEDCFVNQHRIVFSGLFPCCGYICPILLFPIGFPVMTPRDRYVSTEK